MQRCSTYTAVAAKTAVSDRRTSRINFYKILLNKSYSPKVYDPSPPQIFPFMCHRQNAAIQAALKVAGVLPQIALFITHESLQAPKRTAPQTAENIEPAGVVKVRLTHKPMIDNVQ